MEPVEPGTFLSDTGHGRRGDRAAERARVPEPGIIDQDQQHVGRALGRRDVPDEVSGTEPGQRPVRRTPKRRTRYRAAWSDRTAHPPWPCPLPCIYLPEHSGHSQPSRHGTLHHPPRMNTARHPRSPTRPGGTSLPIPGCPAPSRRGNPALRNSTSADAPEQPVLDVPNQPDSHRPRRTERRVRVRVARRLDHVP